MSLAARAQPQGLQRAFAVFLVVVGVFTILKTELGAHKSGMDKSGMDTMRPPSAAGTPPVRGKD